MIVEISHRAQSQVRRLAPVGAVPQLCPTSHLVPDCHQQQLNHEVLVVQIDAEALIIVPAKRKPELEALGGFREKMYQRVGAALVAPTAPCGTCCTPQQTGGRGFSRSMLRLRGPGPAKASTSSDRGPGIRVLTIVPARAAHLESKASALARRSKAEALNSSPPVPRLAGAMIKAGTSRNNDQGPLPRARNRNQDPQPLIAIPLRISICKP
jgi:hypothetical protein